MAIPVAWLEVTGKDNAESEQIGLAFADLEGPALDLSKVVS